MESGRPGSTWETLAEPFDPLRSYHNVDLAVVLGGRNHLGKLQDIRDRILERLGRASGIRIDAAQVRIAMLEPGSRKYLGHLGQTGGALDDIEGYIFDAAGPKQSLLARV
jgi:hypothetical protein